MPMHQHEPHAVLADYVKTVWCAERVFTPDTMFEILPDSYIELLFTFGAACQLDDGVTLRPMPPACVIGLLTKPLYLHADGHVTTIGARFFAWGFSALFGFTLDQPFHSVAFESILTALAARIAPHVAGGDSASALHELHTCLLERAVQIQFTQRDVQQAAHLLAQNGVARIEDVANQCFVSRRQLERKFQTSMGVSPKTLARKLRFEQVRDRLWREPRIDLAALADEYGYADQSHLNREFKQFSNRTPAHFAAEMAALYGALHAADGAIIQDS